MSTNTDDSRFVEPPEGFFKNPDCDLHYSDDLLTRPPETDGGLACIDIRSVDDNRYEVSLNAGINGNHSREDYDSLVVARGHVQLAVDLLAERSRPTENGGESE